jgi:AraC family transcriptional regulator
MQPEIQTLESCFVVAGIQASFGQGSKPQIPLLWKQLFERFDSIPAQSAGGTYGVCSAADPEEGRFDYLAGAEVAPGAVLPKDITSVRIPAGMTAIFRRRLTTGSLHEPLQETLRWIWRVWLPASRFKYSPAPDFERDPGDFDPASESSY